MRKTLLLTTTGLRAARKGRPRAALFQGRPSHTKKHEHGGTRRLPQTLTIGEREESSWR